MEEEELPLAQLAVRLTEAGIPCDTEAAREALTESEDFQTSAVRSIDEIAEDMSHGDTESDMEDEENVTEVVPVKPTHKGFLAALVSKSYSAVRQLL